MNMLRIRITDTMLKSSYDRVCAEEAASRVREHYDLGEQDHDAMVSQICDHLSMSNFHSQQEAIQCGMKCCEDNYCSESDGCCKPNIGVLVFGGATTRLNRPARRPPVVKKTKEEKEESKRLLKEEQREFKQRLKEERATRKEELRRLNQRK